MRRLMKVVVMAGLAAVVALGTQMAMAQEPPGGGDPGARRGRQGPGGQRGQFDPAQFRERMMQRMQEQLGSTDEEWAGIEPLLGKVTESQRAVSAGRPRGGGAGFGAPRGGRGAAGGRGGSGGPRAGARGPGGPEGADGGPQAGRRGPRPEGAAAGGGGRGAGGGRGGGGFGGGGFGGPPPSAEVAALQEILASDDATPRDIKAKLQAVRQANRKTEQALKRSRDNLRAVLTVKQEAQLVLMGILD